jgi:hypothetical protein
MYKCINNHEKMIKEGNENFALAYWYNLCMGTYLCVGREIKSGQGIDREVDF